MARVQAVCSTAGPQLMAKRHLCSFLTSYHYAITCLLDYLEAKILIACFISEDFKVQNMLHDTHQKYYRIVSYRIVHQQYRVSVLIADTINGESLYARHQAKNLCDLSHLLLLLLSWFYWQRRRLVEVRSRRPESQDMNPDLTDSRIHALNHQASCFPQRLYYPRT